MCVFCHRYIKYICLYRTSFFLINVEHVFTMILKVYAILELLCV